MSSVKVQKHNGITWANVESPTKKDLFKLADEYGFHPLHIEECLSRGQLPQIEVEDNYIFLILYFPYYKLPGRRIVTSQVGVFLGRDFLFTIHGDSAPSIRSLFAQCEKDEELRDEYFQGTSPGYLLYAMVRRLLDDASDLTHLVLQELEEIEDSVFDDEESEGVQISQLRHKIMRLRRMTAALKTTLADLSGRIDEFTGENLARFYSLNTKLTRRLWETVEEASETVEIFKDADFTANTEKTNDILAVLTLLFTFTLPATVVGTLYGMNILLPGGTEAGSWMFLGQYTAFKIVVAVSVVSGLVMYWYFKKKKWI